MGWGEETEQHVRRPTHRAWAEGDAGREAEAQSWRTRRIFLREKRDDRLLCRGSESPGYGDCAPGCAGLCVMLLGKAGSRG